MKLTPLQSKMLKKVPPRITLLCKMLKKLPPKIALHCQIFNNYPQYLIITNVEKNALHCQMLNKCTPKNLPPGYIVKLHCQMLKKGTPKNFIALPNVAKNTPTKLHCIAKYLIITSRLHCKILKKNTTKNCIAKCWKKLPPKIALHC